LNDRHLLRGFHGGPGATTLTPRPDTRLQPFRFPGSDRFGNNCSTEESIHELLGLTSREPYADLNCSNPSH
jgi:hypothetical protein